MKTTTVIMFLVALAIGQQGLNTSLLRADNAKVIELQSAQLKVLLDARNTQLSQLLQNEGPTHFQRRVDAAAEIAKMQNHE
jgi:hypothetical protein